MINKFGFYDKFDENSYSSTYARRESTGSFKVEPISFIIKKPNFELKYIIDSSYQYIATKKKNAIKWTAGLLLPLGVAIMATANPPIPNVAPESINQKQITSIALWGTPNASFDVNTTKVRVDRKSFESLFSGIISPKVVDAEIYKCTIRSKGCPDGVPLTKLISSVEKQDKVDILEQNFNKFIKEKMKLSELPKYNLSVDNSGKKPVYFFSLEKPAVSESTDTKDPE